MSLIHLIEKERALSAARKLPDNQGLVRDFHLKFNFTANPVAEKPALIPNELAEKRLGFLRAEIDEVEAAVEKVQRFLEENQNPEVEGYIQRYEEPTYPRGGREADVRLTGPLLRRRRDDQDPDQGGQPGARSEDSPHTNSKGRLRPDV